MFSVLNLFSTKRKSMASWCELFEKRTDPLENNKPMELATTTIPKSAKYFNHHISVTI